MRCPAKFLLVQFKTMVDLLLCVCVPTTSVSMRNVFRDSICINGRNDPHVSTNYCTNEGDNL